MKLTPLTRSTRLFARRTVNLGGRRVLPGQELITSPNGPGALSWRRISQLYDQRRVISEADPYFEELMRGPGLENNPGFAKAWLAGGAVVEPELEEEEAEEDDEADRSAEEQSKGAAPQPDPGPGADGDSSGPEVLVQSAGGGWYDVIVNGERANEKRLRKWDAEILADGLRR
jgi:hypothetical protein